MSQHWLVCLSVMNLAAVHWFTDPVGWRLTGVMCCCTSAARLCWLRWASHSKTTAALSASSRQRTWVSLSFNSNYRLPLMK